MREPETRGLDKHVGNSLVSSDGEKLGTIARFVPNRVTEIPEWIVIEAGLFGTKQLVVPVAGADFEDSEVRVAYPKQVVVEEPDFEDAEELSPEAESILEAYFGLGAAVPPDGFKV